MIFCTNCGKQIDDNSKFCPFCGATVAGNHKDDPEETTQQSSPLWDKFTSIRDAQGEKREKYINFISDASWGVMSNMRQSTLEGLKESHNDEIGNLPYKDVEIILGYFLIAQRDGYLIKLSSRLLKNSRIKKSRGLTEDKIVSIWQKELEKDIDKVTEPEELKALNIMSEFVPEQLFENEDITDLSSELKKSLRSAFYKLNYWGFVLAVAEEKLTK